ncbi:integrase [Bacillus pumilus]|nr:site-specific integrase [Bacillus pumilus]OBS84272.1 integrase [Bacillus pumilus]
MKWYRGNQLHRFDQPIGNSIEKRGEKSFRLVLEVGTKGNRKKEYKPIKIEDPKILKSKRKLNTYLEEEWYKFKREYEEGAYINSGKRTFKLFLTDWFEKYGVKSLDEVTLETYNSIINTGIIEYFGEMEIEKVQPIHILNFLDDYTKKNPDASSSSIHARYKILRDIFGKAADWRLINENPVANVKPPKVTYKEYDIYTEEEIKDLFKLLNEKASLFHRVAIKFAFTGGFRRGELLAIDESDLSFETNKVRIDESLQYTKKYGHRFKEPKSKSYRTISLPEEVMKEAAILLREVKKNRLKLGELWEGCPEDKNKLLLFGGDRGKPLHPTSLNTWWSRFVKRHDIKKIRFHDMRHTHATMLINQVGKIPGFNIKSVSKRLGHTNVKTTLETYTHSDEGADDLVADAITNLLQIR